MTSNFRTFKRPHASPSPRTQVNDDGVIYTPNGMRASVLESPRISHRNHLPPMSLEGEDCNSSRGPSYSINLPQLYPYSHSEGDIWSGETVENIFSRLSCKAVPIWVTLSKDPIRAAVLAPVR